MVASRCATFFRSLCSSYNHLQWHKRAEVKEGGLYRVGVGGGICNGQSTGGKGVCQLVRTPDMTQLLSLPYTNINNV